MIAGSSLQGSAFCIATDWWTTSTSVGMDPAVPAGTKHQRILVALLYVAPHSQFAFFFVCVFVVNNMNQSCLRHRMLLWKSPVMKGFGLCGVGCHRHCEWLLENIYTARWTWASCCFRVEHKYFLRLLCIYFLQLTTRREIFIYIFKVSVTLYFVMNMNRFLER